MEKFKDSNLNNIKTIIQRETNVTMRSSKQAYPFRSRIIGRYMIVAAGVLFLAVLSAFAYQRFNSLKGDDLALKSIYLGEGKFEIFISNISDKDLILEDKVRLMKWSDSSPVKGNPKLIKVETEKIGAGKTGVISIDISDGYDIAEMKDDLKEGDWYYFVLTNNRFALGQDWMCSIDLTDRDPLEPVTQQPEEIVITPEDNLKSGNADDWTEVFSNPLLAFPDWTLPTDELNVTNYFGAYTSPSNPDRIFYSNHINISGDEGDPVYAVCDGTISFAGYDSSGWGNKIILSAGNDVYIMYGHLKEFKVKEGDLVSKGDVIAFIGKTGIATGPNLAFSVNMNGEYVNPLAK